MNNNNLHTIIYIAISCVSIAFAKAQQPTTIQNEYNHAVAQASEHDQNNEFNLAEAQYRKATAIKPDAAQAQYNMGNLYYKNNKKYNAVQQYKNAAKSATSKTEKHQIYHNLGNTFLENKQYPEAIEAYKNALRNDPTDDQTRYNLAIAKQEQEKNGGGGSNDNDPNKDKDQDNKQGDQDQNSDGNKDDDQQQKDDQNDKQNEGDNQPDDQGQNSEGDQEGDQEKQGNQDQSDDQGDTQENKQQQPQRVDGKITPQQARQLLEALSNEEQRIQEKLNAKKQKGTTIKTEKDW